MSEESMEEKLKSYNEFMLKNAAITFSTEGLSKDIKIFLDKKISYNIEMMKHLSSMVRSVTMSEDSKLKSKLFDDGSVIKIMIGHLYEEMRVVDMALNLVIQKLLEKEQTLIQELHDIPVTKPTRRTKGTKGASNGAK